MTHLERRERDGCVSDFKLDQWLAGELGSSESEALNLHLESCDYCATRERELRRGAAQFLQEFPELPSLPVAKRPRPPVWLAGAGTLVALAAAFALWSGGRTPDEAGTRSKGGARLGFFVKRADQVTQGLNGQRVYPGDQLRFVLTTSTPSHVAILGRDAAGTVSVYYPSSPQSVQVGAVRESPVDSSIELDAVLGEEQIWAIFCDHGFEIAPLSVTLSSESALTPPAGCSIDQLRLSKGTKP